MSSKNDQQSTSFIEAAFRALMNKVGAQSSVDKEWNRFTFGDMDTLAEDIRKEKKTSSNILPISRSTLRDYQLQARGMDNHPILNKNGDPRASIYNLNLLAAFVGMKSWDQFLKSFEEEWQHNAHSAIHDEKLEPKDLQNKQVYVCYDPRDKAFVSKLSQKLQAYGIHAWVWEVELQFGDSIREKIANSIEASDVVIAVISRYSIGSFWVKKELYWALNKESEDSQFKIIPVLIDGSTPPFILSDKLHANFNDDFEKVVQQLSESIMNKKNAADKVNFGDHPTLKYNPANTIFWAPSILTAIGLFGFIISIYFNDLITKAANLEISTTVSLIYMLLTGCGITELLKTIILKLSFNRNKNFALDAGSLFISHILFKNYRNLLWRYRHDFSVQLILVLEICVNLALLVIMYYVIDLIIYVIAI